MTGGGDGWLIRFEFLFLTVLKRTESNGELEQGKETG